MSQTYLFISFNTGDFQWLKSLVPDTVGKTGIELFTIFTRGSRNIQQRAFMDHFVSPDACKSRSNQWKYHIKKLFTVYFSHEQRKNMSICICERFKKKSAFMVIAEKIFAAMSSLWFVYMYMSDKRSRSIIVQRFLSVSISHTGSSSVKASCCARGMHMLWYATSADLRL